MEKTTIDIKRLLAKALTVLLFAFCYLLFAASSNVQAITVTACIADVNKDGVVNSLDLNLTQLHFGETPSSPGWNPIYDVDGDGTISILDLGKISSLLGQTCPANLLQYTLSTQNSGSNVNFTLSAASTGNITVKAIDSSGAVVFDSSIIPSGQTSATWTNAPAGNYTATAFSGATVASTSVPFTVATSGIPGGVFSLATSFSPASRFSTFGKLASDIILILTSLSGAISMVFIVVAGIKFVTASGDSKKLSSAQATLTYALIGLIVTILAFVILRLVQFFFGANIPLT